MAPRSTGRTSLLDKPVKTKAFEQTDDSQHHQEDRQTVKCKYKETVVFLFTSLSGQPFFNYKAVHIFILIINLVVFVWKCDVHCHATVTFQRNSHHVL